VAQGNKNNRPDLNPKKGTGMRTGRDLSPADQDFRPNYQRVREVEVDGQGKHK